jgi:hypothetical protein
VEYGAGTAQALELRHEGVAERRGLCHRTTSNVNGHT